MSKQAVRPWGGGGGPCEDLGLTGQRGALSEGFELGLIPYDLTLKGALNRP